MHERVMYDNADSVAVCCSLLQSVAVRCSALQCLYVFFSSRHVYIRSFALQCVAVSLCFFYGENREHTLSLALQHTATHALQCVAVSLCFFYEENREHTLSRAKDTATHCNTLSRAATHCNTLYTTALWGESSMRIWALLLQIPMQIRPPLWIM